MLTHIIPLGTASAIPTPNRHLPATLLSRNGRFLLFDCGEGTQHTLLRNGFKLSRLDAVFITHLHGDHVYGLPGLLSTLAFMQREEPLTVVGPKGVRKLAEASLRASNDSDTPYPLRFVEVEEDIEKQVVFEEEDFLVCCRPLVHRTPVLGFRFQEKERPGKVNAERAHELGIEGSQFGLLQDGMAVVMDNGRVVRPDDVIGPPRPGLSFVYCTDTRPCSSAIYLGHRADLLMYEATFERDLFALAGETGHSTSREAALVAAQAGARRLLLTHFSARYTDPSLLVQQAREVFPNTEAAVELKTYALEPHLRSVAVERA